VSVFRLLATVVGALDRAEVPHMLTGAHASTFHGEPRATNDADLVIDPDLAGFRLAMGRLREAGLYCGDEEAALEHRSMCNVIDPATGAKVDLIVRKDRPFSVSEMARRIPVVVDDVALWIATAEDLILAKLEWARLGGSERQRRDIAGVVDVSGHELDLAYLRRWATELGLDDDLREVLATRPGDGETA